MVKELLNISVRVEKIRFEGNGVIFTGRVIDNSGVQTGEEIVVRCPGNILSPRATVFKGEIWSIAGYEESFRGEQQLGAIKAFLKRPTGENIISAIAFNPKFKGIGEKKAREIWATFGEDLYGLLDADEPDVAALQQILTPDAADCLLSIWKAEYSSDLYRWLDKHQISKVLSRRLQEHYGKEAQSKIEEDPYRVLAFGQSWSNTDRIANRLGVADDDPRRLHAAVAEILYQHFGKGHTAISTSDLTSRVARLLCARDSMRGQCLAHDALKHTYADGAFVQTGNLWQAAGVYLMEAFIADRVSRMVNSISNKQGDLWDRKIDSVINCFEITDHILSDEQKAAVQLAVKGCFCVITGGAGVGKTSVLRCIYNAVEEKNGTILQMALSGRAAKRMEDASGRPARTIAGFLTHIKPEDLEKVTHVVIDEASMLDVVSAFQILRKLPGHIKLILVGDPYQLPPIGPGLPFHTLVDDKRIPIARLTKVYRQSCDSGIPIIAEAIRGGLWPQIPAYCGKQTGVFSLKTIPNDTAKMLFEIYEELGGVEKQEEIQILSAIKADNVYGVAGINKAFHTRYREGKTPILVKSPAGEQSYSGFHVGDRIMVTKNQWERQLFNGSLGYIAQAFKTPILLKDNHYAIAKAFIDGKEVYLTEDDFYWIVHSYSISIHKSQGSQFTRVIVPICKSKLLDRTLVYTAVTRGVDQVVLLGDLHAAKLAVESQPHAWLRQIGFKTIMHNSIRSEQEYGT